MVRETSYILEWVVICIVQRDQLSVANADCVLSIVEWSIEHKKFRQEVANRACVVIFPDLWHVERTIVAFHKLWFAVQLKIWQYRWRVCLKEEYDHQVQTVTAYSSRRVEKFVLFRPFFQNKNQSFCPFVQLLSNQQNILPQLHLPIRGNKLWVINPKWPVDTKIKLEVKNPGSCRKSQ